MLLYHIHHIWHYRARLRESGQPIGRLRKTCKNAFPRTIPVSSGRLDTSIATESSLKDRHPIHLQWIPSHVVLLGNEVPADLAKAATSNPVDPENRMILTSTEIYSRAKEFICRIWVVPPVHPCTFWNVWGFHVRRLLHPPAILRLCRDLWTHGSGLVTLDQMEISPTTTTVSPNSSAKLFKSTFNALPKNAISHSLLK
ncbi:uncharacterized protein TNCV_4297631 [Trichonephila clavipes]|nr:uncharacterized protein TNCV_4297631 [Trichonephila clavipes]